MTGYGKGKMSDSPGELPRIIWKRWMALTQEELKGKKRSEVTEG